MRSLILALLVGLSIPSLSHSEGTSDTVKRSLGKMVAYRGDAGNLGWAVPISGRTLLTAAHLVDGGPGQWHKPLYSGTLASITYHNVKRDLSILMVGEADGDKIPGMVPLAGKLPEPGSPVWWKCHGFWEEPHNLNTATPLIVLGTFMGASNNVIFLEGFVQGGCSGSGVVNENGELIGVISGAVKWTDSDVVTSATIARPYFKGRQH